MKKEISVMDQSSKNIPFKYMTKVESQQMAILTKNSSFKEKYRHALIASTKIDLFQLAQSNPDLTAKDVLIYILKGYDPQLPTSILGEMTQFILTEWEILQTSKSNLVYT